MNEEKWIPKTPYDRMFLLEDDPIGLKESWLRDQGYYDDED